MQRTSENEKRQLRLSVASDLRDDLERRVRYKGSGKHKRDPYAFGLDPAPRDADDTLCDDHAGFTPSDLPGVPDMLRRGVRAGLVGHNDIKADPTILWCVSEAGWVYEARITVPTQALYHGYPLLPSDPFAKVVLARYERWVYARNDPDDLAGLQSAQELYR